MKVLGVGIRPYSPPVPMPVFGLPRKVFFGENPWNDQPHLRKIIKQHSDFQRWRRGADTRAEEGIMQGQQDQQAETKGRAKFLPE